MQICHLQILAVFMYSFFTVKVSRVCVRVHVPLKSFLPPLPISPDRYSIQTP